MRSADRYRDLDEASDRLLGRDVSRETSPPDPALTLVHRQCIDLLDELLLLAPSDAPGPILLFVRTLRRMKPIMVKELPQADPDKLVHAMHYFGAKLNAIGVEPEATVEQVG